MPWDMLIANGTPAKEFHDPRRAVNLAGIYCCPGRASSTIKDEALAMD